MKHEVVIGLEVHIGLNTDSKMFCSCSNDSNAQKPNVNICPVCIGHPGTLPVINKKALEKTVKTGLALNCEIPEYSRFDRKNYFYPDLPKGYQISQQEYPLCKGGYLDVNGRRIKITRIHLEEDAGKLLHPSGDYSLVDFNRSSTPLMELVTEPDIRTATEASEFVKELRTILKYLDVSNADMEKGEMRVDANISLSLTPGKMDGIRVEIKNLNSFKSIEKALQYEIERQSKIINEGQRVLQETRGWDDTKEETISQRSKEEAHDYRYFPEPDLPAISFGEEELLEIRASISELPSQKKERFKQEYGLSEKELNFFILNREIGDYYEKTVSESINWIKEFHIKSSIEDEERLVVSRLVANYILTDLQGLLKLNSISIDKCLITPENFGEFIFLSYKDKISSKIAKIIIKEMFETGGDPTGIIEKSGLTEVKDESEIEVSIDDVIKENPIAVKDYKNGKESSIQFLTGKVMAKTKGRANPNVLAKILKEKLDLH